MRSLVYITAAILATAAGYWVMYVNFLPQDSNKKQAAKTVEAPKHTDRVKNEKKYPKNKDLDISAIKAGTTIRGLNTGHMATFVVRQKPQDLADFKFQDAGGVEKTMKDWAGKVVLLNLWATWCAPCRKEMPDLDLLKAKLGGENFDVVTISIDKGGIRKPQNFFRLIEIENLKLYHDKTARIHSKLKAFGMPTTILLNRQGKEIGRLIGPAEWASEDAVRLIKTAIAVH